MKAFVINVDRRHRPRVRGDPHLPRARHLRLPGRSSTPPASTFTTNQGVDRRDLPADLRRRVREVGAGPAPHLARRTRWRARPRSRALIHAATMVTAGVYLIARMFPLFELAPTAADIAAFVGLATLLIAATIALVVTDLKRIIAYSTMSQIGYMIMGVSIGAYSGRPLPSDDARLLQGAAVHGGRLGDRGDGRTTRTSTGMSGFREAMPFTSALLIVGALALAGVPGHLRLLLARTRSSPSPPTAAACTGSSRSAATSARC